MAKFNFGRKFDFIGTDANEIISSNPFRSPLDAQFIPLQPDWTSFQMNGGDDIVEVGSFDRSFDQNLAGSLSFTFDGGSGDDRFFGGASEDMAQGGQNEDHLYGSGGNDKLDGGDHNDHLAGGEGSDILIGGKGTDFLFGDEGRLRFAQDVTSRLEPIEPRPMPDTFVFTKGSSTSTSTKADTIGDWNGAEDLIDMPFAATAANFGSISSRGLTIEEAVARVENSDSLVNKDFVFIQSERGHSYLLADLDNNNQFETGINIYNNFFRGYNDMDHTNII